MRWLLHALAVAGAFPVSAAEITSRDLSALPEADIYLLGEIHDDRVHHQRQAQAIKGIAPVALVFEMLTPAQAAAAKDAPRDDMAALGAAMDWDSSGWPTFEEYYPIFVAAPNAAIYGAALPREDVRNAIGDGAAAIFGAQAEQYGLTEPLPKPEQAAREKLQAEAHCGALPEEMLPGMVEAQRLRDASFARTALQALAETGGPVAVITGNGHAHSGAMPAALAKAAPETRVLSLGQLYGTPPEGRFDLWILSEAPVRGGDPCDAFKS